MIHEMGDDGDDPSRGPQQQLRDQPAGNRRQGKVEDHRFDFLVRPFAFDRFHAGAGAQRF